MFTGIIEGLGTIASLRAQNQGLRLAVTAGFDLTGTRIGDSMAVNGACLTAVAIAGRRFEADVSPESLLRTTLGRLKTGDPVNLERALRLSGRIDGHLVSGHIDGTGTIAFRRHAGQALILGFTVAPELARYMIQKGSVAVDGVSLTLNAAEPGHFEVSLIPHTAGQTTLGVKGVGEAVNIETDMIAKYVERLMRPPSTPEAKINSRPLDLRFLAESGFL